MSNFNITGTILAQLVLKAIMMLEGSGCFIDGIICDGAATNRKVWTQFGIRNGPELFYTSYSGTQKSICVIGCSTPFQKYKKPLTRQKIS